MVSAFHRSSLVDQRVSSTPLWSTVMSRDGRAGGSDGKGRQAHGRRRREGAWASVLGLLSAGAGVVVALIANVASADFQWPDWLTADQMASVLGVAASLTAVLLAILVTGFQLRSRTVPSAKLPAEPTVSSRIEEAARSLQVTAQLVDELRAEMQARAAALDRLQVENAEYEKLAALRKEEAEAVSRMIENVIGSTHAKLSRSSRRDQALFFALGLSGLPEVMSVTRPS
jgi:hypothetical protein